MSFPLTPWPPTTADLPFEQRVVNAKKILRATSTEGVQRRTVPFSVLDVRDGATDGAYEIVGHAAVFEMLSHNLGGFREKIESGAFANVLAGSGSAEARALFNHDPSLVLASRRNGTLALAEDDTGLAYRAQVPSGLYYGEALRVLLRRGDVHQSSFAFRVGEDRWDEDEETGALVRTILEFSALYDVSPVTYPAYPQTDVDVDSSAIEVCGEDALCIECEAYQSRENGECEYCGHSPLLLDVEDIEITPPTDTERGSERGTAPMADPMADRGDADGAKKGHSLGYIQRDLAIRERELSG